MKNSNCVLHVVLALFLSKNANEYRSASQKRKKIHFKQRTNVLE